MTIAEDRADVLVAVNSEAQHALINAGRFLRLQIFDWEQERRLTAADLAQQDIRLTVIKERLREIEDALAMAGVLLPPVAPCPV